MNRTLLKKAEAKLRRYLHIEKEYWKQKAGMRWFKDGDRNTKFFHSYVRGRRKKLHIHEIKTGQGDVTNGTDNIGTEAVQYNEEHFKESSYNVEDRMLNHIPRLVTDAQNEKND